MGYSSVTVFGDSLIDAGNALRLADWYGGLPFTEPVDAAPTADKGYYDGRFTNGLTFADLISNKYVGLTTKPVFPYGYEDPYLGLPIAPFASDPSGNSLNFAYGGAQLRQGDEAVPDLDGQTDAWRHAVDGHADPSGLYLFSFGANDVHDLVPKTGAWADLATAEAALQAAADKYAHEIMQAIEIGARKILVVGVPDIGVQPYYNGVADEAARRAAGTQYSQMLDQMVQTALGGLQLPTGAQLQYAGFEAMSDYVLGEMTQIYGSQAIFPLNTSSLVFFDKAHPTTQMHALAAAYLIDQLGGTSSGDQLKLVAPNYSVSGSIGAAGEVDTIIISLPASIVLNIQMLGLSTLGGDATVLGDPALRVLGPNGSLFASNDDGGMGLDASLTFTSGASGDYTVQLSGVGGLTGNYSFLAEGAALGDDTYLVSHGSALILERSGEGHDTVRTSVTYALGAGVSIENLSTNSDLGKNSISLTGNEFEQIVRGNAGNNVIDGKAGADQLWGLAGKDTFLFSSTLGNGNVDRIMDFNVRDDTIWLDHAVFQGLNMGTLASGAFAKGTAASQADDRIIYDAKTGSLYFDADGLDGADQVLVAILSANLKVTHADFIVI
ncbi:MAG: SGNH/GDSL hydrolase family protein [Sphingomicrobium sp.]